VKAGYPVDRDELRPCDWQGLAVITRYYEVKDIEAATRRAQGG
jgi:hypothetical protein